jgi:hypothetical protein
MKIRSIELIILQDSINSMRRRSKNYRFCTLLMLLTVVSGGASAFEQTALDGQAIDFCNKKMDQYFAKRGSDWYARSDDIIQGRSVSIKIAKESIKEDDRLNEIDWSGSITAEATAWRARASENKWGAWQGPVLMYGCYIYHEKGNWKIIKTGFFGGGRDPYLAKPTNEQIPP